MTVAALKFISGFLSFHTYCSEHRKVRLTLACLVAVSLSRLTSLLTVLNVFPTFFINGIDVTLTDQIVFSTAFLLFSINSAFSMAVFECWRQLARLGSLCR